MATTGAAPHLPRLRDSVLHDASHVSDGQVDVLFSEVLLDAAIVVVVQTLLRVVCRKKTCFQSKRPQQDVFSAFLMLLTFLRLEDIVTRRHVLARDAQLGGVGG